MAADWLNKWSLESRGTRRQIGVATALMVVLPNLVICYVALFSPEELYSTPAKAALGAMAALVAVGGFLLLNRHPRTVGRLRHYLRQIAAGELPASIAVPDTDNDIRDVETLLNLVLDELRRKVALLESQQEELLEAERQRAMISSLGAACHHIGQPASLLRTHLHFLKNRSSSKKDLAEIAECEKAVDSIAEILDKLRHVGSYRTVPYRTSSASDAPGADAEILNID